MSKWTKFRDSALKPIAGAAVGAGLAWITGGASLFVGAAAGMALGTQAQSSYDTAKYNKATLKNQQRSLAEQSAELQRQRKREIEQQKRENEQLMSSISNLTNTAYSGVSSPSVDYDKYGDLG